MSDFDPDAYINENAAPAQGFDPDAYISENTSQTPTAAPSSDPGYLESLARGVGQGATLGFADEAAGGVDAAVDKILGSNPGKSLGELYDQHVAENRAANSAAQSAHPWLYGAGNIAGGVGLGLATGGLGAEALAAKAGAAAAPVAAGMTAAGAMADAPALASVGQMVVPAAQAATRVGVGAAAGAVGGVGFGNPDNLHDAVSDAAQGAKTGALVGGAVEGVRALSGGAADAVDSFANRKTVRAMNANSTQYNELVAKGKIDSLGQTMRDNGIGGPFSSLSSKLEQVRGVEDEETGQMTGGLVQNATDKMLQVGDTLDDAGIKAPSNTQLANALEARFVQPLEGLKTATATKNAMQDLVDDIRNHASFQGDDFDTLQRIKNLVNTAVKNNGGFKGPPPSSVNAALRQASGMVAEGQEAAIEKGVNQLGQPDLLDQFLNSKTDLGNARTAQGILTGSTSRQAANQMFGLKSTALAAAELARGNVMGAVKTAGLMKFGQTYGNNLMAYGADKLADILRADPTKLGPWQGQLSSALARGGSSLGATNFILQQTSPEYREHTRKLFGDQ